MYLASSMAKPQSVLVILSDDQTIVYSYVTVLIQVALNLTAFEMSGMRLSTKRFSLSLSPLTL
jgi:hypothetical protein